jgi:SPP1 gp7 family putative phage head morphogenesis protein
MAFKFALLPMEAAQIFWRDKVQVSPSEFRELENEAKLRAFAVSGIAKGDELSTVYLALQKAVDQGTSFEQFQKECAGIFERRGWTGKRAWRIDNIFRTNIQTAYNVGHYQQLMQDRDVLEYWQYSAINDRRVRPTHLAMDNRVWPANHPVWATWFPPNGYR